MRRSVQFFPDRGENCLFVTVDGIDYEFVPPPEEIRDWLLRVGRNLSAGSGWRGILRRWKALLLRRRSCGLVTLDWSGPTGQRFCSEWTGVFSPKGLVFRRTPDAYAIESGAN